MLKRNILVIFAVILCLGITGVSNVYASNAQTSDNHPKIISIPKDVQVKIEKRSCEQVLESNKEYLDFIKTNLGYEEAKRIEAELMEPWDKIPPEGATITIKAVEIRMAEEGK